MAFLEVVLIIFLLRLIIGLISLLQCNTKTCFKGLFEFEVRLRKTKNLNKC